MDDQRLDEKITRFLQGDESFADEVVELYFDRLVSLARSKLTSVPPQIADSEGAVVSALRSFFSGLHKNGFPKLNDQNELWRVLAIITVRKAVAQIRRHWKKSGEGGKVDVDAELNDLIVNAPSPDNVVALLDECEQRVESLQDDALRQVAIRILAGYDTADIANELNVNRRTVQRKLALIQKIWRSEK